MERNNRAKMPSCKKSRQWLLCLLVNVVVLQRRVCGFVRYISRDDKFPFLTLNRCPSLFFSTLNEKNAYLSHSNDEYSEIQSPSESSFGLTDEEFASWISSELANAPGRQEYTTTFDSAIVAIVKWRQRFRGNPVVWKRIFKRDRVFKELIESAPILHMVLKHVNSDEISALDDDKVTIVDLCSGKGYLSMFLSEMLPPKKVEKIVLVDKAWAMCNGEVLPHHMNWDHIYGKIPQLENFSERGDEKLVTKTNSTYFTTWPIPLHTSKQDLKQSCNQRQMKKHFFDRTKGPIIILAVHLCGTLSLRAVDFFNNNENVKMFCLKPCCLPAMDYAKREVTFTIGNHSFPATEVCSNGSFKKMNWSGPPRWHLEKKFHLWSDHLYKGIDIIESDEDSDNTIKPLKFSKKAFGKKAKREVQVQVDGGFQNTYLLAERSPLTTEFWS